MVQKLGSSIEQDNGETCEPLIWGEKLTCDERKKVIEICAELWGEENKIKIANELMVCIALETGGKFTPDITKGDGIGLIQFTGAAIKDMNRLKYNNGAELTKNKLGNMTVMEQLDYVNLYFQMHLKDYKRTLQDAMDMYMCTFCPAAVGQSDSFVLYEKGESSYNQNSSIDGEYYDEKGEQVLKGKADGKITRGELKARLQMWEAKGISRKNKCKTDASTCEFGSNTGNQTNEDGILEEMKKLADKHIPYSQLGVRNSLSEEGIKALDCSEFVGIYLHKLGVMPNYTNIDTGVMTTESSFREAIGSQNIDLVTGSTKSDFKPQRGDIFVWRDGDGHTGIVYEYNAKTDVVTILEAIGWRGATGESKQVANGGYSGKDCTRTAKYGRLDGAMYGHRGWKGFFRPKNYDKKL